MAVDMKLTSFEREIKRANKMLNHIQKDQIPFATAIATTSLVGALNSPFSRAGKTLPKSGLLQNQRQMIKKQLHRPIKYTLDGYEALPSNKKIKPIQARFGFREFTSKGTPSHKYLSPNIFGGRRNLKRHEQFCNSLCYRHGLPLPGFRPPEVLSSGSGLSWVNRRNIQQCGQQNTRHSQGLH